MNQQEAAQKLATTMLVHKLFTDNFEDLDRAAVLEAVRGGVKGWFAQTRRQSTKDNAWYQAWEEAQEQTEIQRVGIDAYFSEPQEASEVEASEAPAIEATQKRVEDIEMVSIWSRMTIHERVAAITDLEVAVEQIKEVDVAGNTHPAYKVRVAPNTDHRVDVWEAYIGRAETSDVRRGYAVFAGIESSAEEARERANALLAAADICDMLNMPIAD